MAHYAKIEDGIVTNVIVADEDHISYLKSQDPTAQWIQTSYNTRGGVHYDPQTGQPSSDQTKALRKNYAGKGFIYNSESDCFAPPKPFASWLFDTNACLWYPPTPMPQDGKMYMWNETELNWTQVSNVIPGA